MYIDTGRVGTISKHYKIPVWPSTLGYFVSYSEATKQHESENDYKQHKSDIECVHALDSVMQNVVVEKSRTLHSAHTINIAPVRC